MHQPAERDRGALFVVVDRSGGFARPALVELDVGVGRASRSRRRSTNATSAATPSTIAAATAAAMPESGPSSNAGTRSIASPITPPSPVGSGQARLRGRQEAKPAASSGADEPERAARSLRGRSGRCVSSRQPQTATGSTSTIEARPSSCISRSAPMAPGAPSRLRTGALVAWLSDGSCTDQVASASAAMHARARSARSRQLSRTRRRSSVAQVVGPVTAEAVDDCVSMTDIARHASAQHRDEAMQRLGRGFLVLHHARRGCSRRRDCSRRPVAREIVARE